MGVGGQLHAPAASAPGKTRYPLYRGLGGPQGQSGWAENLVPIGIQSRTVQPTVSRYTDWATQPTPKWHMSNRNNKQTGNNCAWQPVLVPPSSYLALHTFITYMKQPYQLTHHTHWMVNYVHDSWPSTKSSSEPNYPVTIGPRQLSMVQ